MSVRTLVSFVTVVILGIVVFAARHDIEQAWNLMGQVDLRILFLLLPIQIISYYASAEMIFSYIRKRLKKKISPLLTARLALEMNFVNHILPSGGMSGVSYMAWRMKHYGISYSKSTTGQLVRMLTGFGVYALFVLIAVVAIVIDGEMNRLVAFASMGIGAVIVVSTAAVLYLLHKETRFGKFARKLVNFMNWSIRISTFGRSKRRVEYEPVYRFFKDIHKDYFDILEHKSKLIAPALWAVVFTVTDIGLFYVTFMALGETINPAPLVIAYGLAAVAGFIFLTPGGAGGYEAVMVLFLGAAGVNPATALAGVLLTRVILVMSTILGGYIFYQQSIIKYGKRSNSKV